MIFENVEKKYIEDAVKIAISEYEAECMKCPQLIKKDFQKEIRELLNDLFENGYGKVALEEGRVIGYLAFEGPWEGFHGKAKGVFSPLGGSGVRGDNRNKLASKLFEAAGNELIKEKVCTYAVSRYAHDDETAKAFIFNNFGIRCSDAVMKLYERKIPRIINEGISCEEIFGEEKKKIAELDKGLIKHLSQAPVFYPTDLVYAKEYNERNNLRLFAAKAHGEIIGYMKLDTEGENYITEDERMYNLGGTFVSEKYRGRKVTEQLLEYICKVISEEGITYLGVDFETMNPTALRFWTKYFTSYSYSFFRRVDERTVGYDKYMEEFYSR